MELRWEWWLAHPSRLGLEVSGLEADAGGELKTRSVGVSRNRWIPICILNQVGHPWGDHPVDVLKRLDAGRNR